MASIGNGTILISICLLLALEPPQCWSSTFRKDCNFKRYEGPPGDVIAKFQATLPAKITLNFSTNALSIMSGIFGIVPVVGSAVGAFYGTIAGLTDPTAGDLNKLVTAVNTLIDDINKTVNDLKEYTDAKVDQHDFDLKKQTLSGLLFAGTHIFEYHDDVLKLNSLRTLQTQILTNQPTFLPARLKYGTYEQLLPLSRTFIGYRIAILIDLFVMTNHSEDYAAEIKTFCTTAYNWYVLAVRNVVKQHTSGFPRAVCTRIKERQICAIKICIGCFTQGETCLQEWKDGAGCEQSLTHSEESCISGIGDLRKVVSLLDQKRDAYIAHITESINTYWRVEMGDAMEKVKQVGLKFGTVESQHTTHVHAAQAAKPVYNPHNYTHFADTLRYPEGISEKQKGWIKSFVQMLDTVPT